MLDNLLYPFHCLLQVSYPELLVIAVRHQDRSRAVQVACMIPFQVRNIGPIIDDNLLEPCVA